MRKTAIMIAAALCAVSCVYPYVAETGISDGRLVVEGDIVPGTVSEFKLSYMFSVDGAPNKETPSGNVIVEDRAGHKYQGSLKEFGTVATYSVDLTGADINAEYRLLVQLRDSREYTSTWAAATDPGEIDKIRCTPSADGSRADITMDFHTNGTSKYYRYEYQEAWEYSAIQNAQYRYIPSYLTDKPAKNPYGLVVRYDGPNNYYCWNSSYHKGINLISMEEIPGGEFKGFELKSIGCSDELISICYSIEASICPISDESYRYFQHVKEGSTYNGDLFAPNPSEMRGNLRNTADDKELVIGYVDVTRKASKRIYVLSKELGIYQPPHVETNTMEVTDSSRWAILYASGYDCYFSQMGTTYWDEKRCIDCTLKGGNKNKPAGWPTNHE